MDACFDDESDTIFNDIESFCGFSWDAFMTEIKEFSLFANRDKH